MLTPTLAGGLIEDYFGFFGPKSFLQSEFSFNECSFLTKKNKFLNFRDL